MMIALGDSGLEVADAVVHAEQVGGIGQDAVGFVR